MRITFVNRLAGIFWGGGETFDLEVARALTQLGHTVQFLVGRRMMRLDIPMREFPTTYIRAPFFPRLWNKLTASQSLTLNRIGWQGGNACIGCVRAFACFKSISTSGILSGQMSFRLTVYRDWEPG